MELKGSMKSLIFSYVTQFLLILNGIESCLNALALLMTLRVNPQWNWKQTRIFCSLPQQIRLLILNGIERIHAIMLFFSWVIMLILNGIERPNRPEGWGGKSPYVNPQWNWKKNEKKDF